jgi:hypothetical protein
MKIRKFIATAFASIFLAVSPLAHAWDGAVNAKISGIDVTTTGSGTYGLRVYLGGATMCTGGGTFAYLEEADSNYKTYLAVLLSSKLTGSPVTVYTTTTGGQCHIGYVVS